MPKKPPPKTHFYHYRTAERIHWSLCKKSYEEKPSTVGKGAMPNITCKECAKKFVFMFEKMVME